MSETCHLLLTEAAGKGIKPRAGNVSYVSRGERDYLTQRSKGLPVWVTAERAA